jgi:hypothetical protein
MTEFKYLNKSEKNAFLPLLFDIFYNNTIELAPSEKSYELQRDEWLSEVSPALEKEPRQVILCYSEDELAGFLMYYTRGELLMVEELQLKKKFQRTRMFYLLCKHLMSVLPSDISIVEAYALKNNLNSQGIMQYLGMDFVPHEIGFPLVHLRGSAEKIKARFLR